MQIIDCLNDEVVASDLTEDEARARLAELGDGYIITEDNHDPDINTRREGKIL